MNGIYIYIHPPTYLPTYLPTYSPTHPPTHQPTYRHRTCLNTVGNINTGETQNLSEYSEILYLIHESKSARSFGTRPAIPSVI